MRAGLKNAEQADDEIDNLEDSTEGAVRGLLGEQRMQQLRDAERNERRQRRGPPNQQGQQPAQPSQQGAQPAAPPPT